MIVHGCYYEWNQFTQPLIIMRIKICLYFIKITILIIQNKTIVIMHFVKIIIQNKTILISTHELDLALALSDRILLMTPGKGIQLDTAANLKKANAFTSAFGMDIFNPLGEE